MHAYDPPSVHSACVQILLSRGSAVNAKKQQIESIFRRRGRLLASRRHLEGAGVSHQSFLVRMTMAGKRARLCSAVIANGYCRAAGDGRSHHIEIKADKPFPS